MEVWKKRINAGNRAFRNHDLGAAIGCYTSACERAKILFGLSFDYYGTVAALVVSHHNLADALLLDGQPAKALEVLTQVHRILLRQLNRPSLAPSRHEALLDGCHRTRLHMSLTVRDLGGGVAECAGLRVAPVLPITHF
ncbi:MAG: hypothetical protein WC247_15400 [Porticoccaceae bacterium]